MRLFGEPVNVPAFLLIPVDDNSSGQFARGQPSKDNSRVTRLLSLSTGAVLAPGYIVIQTLAKGRESAILGRDWISV